MAKTRKKNVSLTNKQRAKIFAYFKRKSTVHRLKYDDLIQWATEEFNLATKPDKSTISKIISRMENEEHTGRIERQDNGHRVNKGRFPVSYIIQPFLK